MGLHREFDESHYYSEYNFEDDVGDLEHKRRVRRKLEDRLDKKRFMEEFDELDGEFNWDEWNSRGQ